MTTENPNNTTDPGFVQTYLADYAKNNDHAEIRVEEGELIIDKPWGGEGVRIVCGISDHEFIEELNQVKLDTRFDALFHLDSDIIEFVFSYLDPDSNIFSDVVDREFKFLFQGVEYECRFAEPTTRLFEIAKKIKRSPAEDAYFTVPQIEQFHDGQKVDDLPERIQKYFKGKVARSFFIKSPVPLSTIDAPQLARHLNLLANYYDRRAPNIVIRKEAQPEEDNGVKVVRYMENNFPNSMVARDIDDFMLTLLEVAGESSPRMSFLYCYQVFEYAGFYYVEDKVRRELRKMLRDPALMNCDEEKVSRLFGLFSGLQHSDDHKMQKVVEACCDAEALWREVENDIDFFSVEQKYDGGYVSKALVSKDMSLENWITVWMPNTFQFLTKIRNCLVHARERRESSVILPSRENNNKILRCLPLITRMAEQVALKSEISDV